MDRYFIKDKIEDGSIWMTYLPTKQQIADILTKSLLKPSYENLSSKLNKFDIHALA